MKNKRSVLVARSKLENELLCSRLNSRFDVVTIDLINYENLESNIEELVKNYDYVILTSKYACKIISLHNLDKKFLVVGLESAGIIRKSTSSEKIMHFNSVAEIINYVKLLNTEKIIYLSGFTISEEIPNICRKIIYKIDYSEKLEDDLVNTIKSKNLDYVMVFSELSFKKLLYILKAHDIISSVESALFVCISKNLANFVGKFFTLTAYSSKPNQEHMIKLMCDYERH
jgi:uroporphyrinogen-III synthase